MMGNFLKGDSMVKASSQMKMVKPIEGFGKTAKEQVGPNVMILNVTLIYQLLINQCHLQY